jgi:serine protease AprX
VKALVESGVAVVASAGNNGKCGGVVGVPAIFEETITVGATLFKSNQIVSFSSKGPVTVDGSNRMKPDVCESSQLTFS